MDAVARKLKRDRKQRYKALRKLRQARDIATRHLRKSYTCLFLRNQINFYEEIGWIQSYTKDELSVIIYEWAKKNIEK